MDNLFIIDLGGIIQMNMKIEYEPHQPHMSELTDGSIAEFLKTENNRFDESMKASFFENEEYTKIISATQKVCTEALRIVENSEIKGFTLAISQQGKDYPVKTTQLGEVLDSDRQVLLALLNTKILKTNPTFGFSGQLSDEGNVFIDYLGAIKYNKGWIISVKGFDNNPFMNVTVNLAIAIGSKLISHDEAMKTARKVNIDCASIFSKYAEVLTKAFYSQSLPEIDGQLSDLYRQSLLKKSH